MKFKIIPYILLATGLIFGACNSDKKAPDSNEKEASSVSAQDSIKVNPAHGLPGHRCDLPVGAPLNSVAQPTPTSELPATSVSPIRIDQTPEVNPPHGEPGHDCSVPVGAKLK